MALASLLRELAALHDAHKAALLAGDAQVVASLEGMRAAFEEADAGREAALAAAVEAVQRAGSERRLDEAVAAALQRLGELEAGYR
jgi:hypothetical protein